MSKQYPAYLAKYPRQISVEEVIRNEQRRQDIEISNSAISAAGALNKKLQGMHDRIRAERTFDTAAWVFFGISPTWEMLNAWSKFKEEICKHQGE